MFVVSLIIQINFIVAYKRISEKLRLKYNILLFLLIFISYFGLYYSGVVLRAGLSISFMALSSASILENKKIKSIILFLLAISFHNSAIIALPILLLLFFNKSIGKKGNITLCFFLLFFHIFQLNTLYMNNMINILKELSLQYDFFKSV